MNKYFELIRITRNNFIELINGLTIDQLNKIPDGFNNNIAWNFGHIVVTTQGLCYRLSGLPFNIDVSLIERYKKGSKPETFIPQTEIDFLKELAVSNINQLEADYNNGIFKNQPFTSYTTSFHITVKKIEDSIGLVQLHDVLHLGYVIAQKKLVKHV